MIEAELPQAFCNCQIKCGARDVIGMGGDYLDGDVHISPGGRERHDCNLDDLADLVSGNPSSSQRHRSGIILRGRVLTLRIGDSVGLTFSLGGS